MGRALPARAVRLGRGQADHGNPAAGVTTAEVARVFAEEWVRVVATLRRDLGDLDAAEDAAQEAFAEAVRSWAVHGVPDRPGAWLTTTARRRAVDRIRRE